MPSPNLDAASGRPLEFLVVAAVQDCSAPLQRIGAGESPTLVAARI
jgi:hypothetical protein